MSDPHPLQEKLFFVLPIVRFYFVVADLILPFKEFFQECLYDQPLP